jgi:hypothetical protein
MNLLTSLHSVFQDQESLGWEEKVEAVGLEEDLDALGLEDTFESGGQDCEEKEDEEESMRKGRRGTMTVWGCIVRGWG